MGNLNEIATAAQAGGHDAFAALAEACHPMLAATLPAFVFAMRSLTHPTYTRLHSWPC